MPEGDTVWLTAKRLQDALAGQTLTAADLRVPQLATTHLTGRTVTDVASRGKHLLLRLDSGHTLHTHLRMDGSWRLGRGLRLPAGGRPHEIRVVLRTADWTAVGYRVHDVAIVPTTHEDDLVGHLGPDLLGRDWDLDIAVRRLAAAPERQIGTALLDQRNLAGIGNLYKAEVLFLSGLSPWTPVTDVRDLHAVVDLARRLLVANRDRWEQVTTGVNRRGEQLWVFERSKQPCRRCRTPIRVDPQGEPPYERLTYWCPSCQPGPGPT